MGEPVDLTFLRSDWLRMAQVCANPYLRNVIQESVEPVLLGNSVTLSLSPIHAKACLVMAELLDIEQVGSDIDGSEEDE